jgi:hypothetical protein
MERVERVELVAQTNLNTENRPKLARQLILALIAAVMFPLAIVGFTLFLICSAVVILYRRGENVYRRLNGLPERAEWDPEAELRQRSREQR